MVETGPACGRLTMAQPKIQLILPMAGESRRFFEAGYKEPKPFFSINGKKMIERVLEQFPPSWDRFFVFNELMKPYADEAKKYLPNPRNLQFVEANKSGPLKSVEKALEIADPARPVFVSYCDYRMLWNPRNFEEFANHSRCDVAIITYRGLETPTRNRKLPTKLLRLKKKNHSPTTGKKSTPQLADIILNLPSYSNRDSIYKKK
jgi:molybdopterin-guanine dinucleotide biosynthesis protein A